MMTNGEQTHELIRELIKTLRSFRQTVQRMLRFHGVDMTFEMLQVMVRLWQQQGISQRRLAELTAKDKASLTNLINNLVKKGWVTRKEDDNDRRNRLIYLTPTGENLSKIVRPVLDSIYDQAGSKMDIHKMELSKEFLGNLNDIFNEI